MPLSSKKYSLERSRLLSLLDILEENSGADGASVYFPAGTSADKADELLKMAGIHGLPENINETVAGSLTGACLFWGKTFKYLLVPPFPLRDMTVAQGYEALPLRRLVSADRRIGLVLVHLGSYAVGLCHGETLVSSKVGTGLVHGRIRKGGSSQGRFQRRRQNQAKEFLERVCGHILDKLQPVQKDLDYIVFGGPRQTVLHLKKLCPFLASIEAEELPLLDVPQVRQPVLEKAVKSIWSSTVIEWTEE